MDRRELLIDLLDDNLSRYDWLLSQISDDCLHWQPDPQANSIATACGALGIRVRTRAELEDALARALAHEGPALVEIISDAQLI